MRFDRFFPPGPIRLEGERCGHLTSRGYRRHAAEDARGLVHGCGAASSSTCLSTGFCGRGLRACWDGGGGGVVGVGRCACTCVFASVWARGATRHSTDSLSARWAPVARARGAPVRTNAVAQPLPSGPRRLSFSLPTVSAVAVRPFLSLSLGLCVYVCRHSAHKHTRRPI